MEVSVSTNLVRENAIKRSKPNTANASSSATSFIPLSRPDRNATVVRIGKQTVGTATSHWIDFAYSYVPRSPCPWIAGSSRLASATAMPTTARTSASRATVTSHPFPLSSPRLNPASGARTLLGVVSQNTLQQPTDRFARRRETVCLNRDVEIATDSREHRRVSASRRRTAQQTGGTKTLARRLGSPK